MIPRLIMAWFVAVTFIGVAAVASVGWTLIYRP